MPRGSRATLWWHFCSCSPCCVPGMGLRAGIGLWQSLALPLGPPGILPCWFLSRMGRRERSRAGRALLGPELGLSPLPVPGGAAQTPLNPPLVPPHVPNPQPLRAIPTLLSHPSCSVFSPHSSVRILRLSQLIFIPLERIMGSTSCLSSPQRVLPSLHGQDKPHSAN